MTRALSLTEQRVLAEDLIYRGAALLDAGQFEPWLSTTSAAFRYRIHAYSPEIRRPMIWLDHDRAGLHALFELLGKHHVDHATWFRQAVLQSVDSLGGESLQTVTRVVIYQTVVDVGDVHVEAGSTKLFAVGRYHDQLVLEGGRWLLAARDVHLDTRQLGIGTHLIV
jgi:methanesulfonate monooxygenase small subunit